MQAIVLPYINPDLDGVACAIAVCFLKGPRWSARVLGKVDPETTVVLSRLGFEVPQTVREWTDIGEIWLVDTHHPSQLPPDLPDMRVTHILDHHGGGDPLRYSKAEIQNESVGAAATLVAEHFESSGTAVPESIAQLLQAAIVSNTLNFLAPATSDRDRAAYAGLRSIAPLGEIVMEQMRAARRSALLADVELVIGEDTKVFETPFGKVIVSQVEAPGALELLERPTLSKALQELARRSNAASAVANLVDTTLVRSAILATDARILNVLAERLRLAPTGDGVILIDRLAQRKTDIVPHLAMTNA